VKRISICAACKDVAKNCDNGVRCWRYFDQGIKCLRGEEGLRRQMQEVKDRLGDGRQGQVGIEDKVKDSRSGMKTQMIGGEETGHPIKKKKKTRRSKGQSRRDKKAATFVPA
jgi:hypothetical protein